MASLEVDEGSRAAGYVTYRKLQRQGLHLKMMYVLTLSFEDSSVVMCRIIYRSKRHEFFYEEIYDLYGENEIHARIQKG